MSATPTGLTLRQLNRTTLLRKSLLERSTDDAATAVSSSAMTIAPDAARHEVRWNGDA
jgi:hypothetical protein